MRAGLRSGSILALAFGLAMAGCDKHEFHPPSEQSREAKADSAYDSALFDSISWSSDSARVTAGNLVFADECRRCHGPLGEGGTPYAEAHDLAVPSLVTRNWPYAGRIDSVRHRIFVGHIGGMPNWGIGALTPRQIDAAAYYVVHQLRTDVLRDSMQVPGG